MLWKPVAHNTRPIQGCSRKPNRTVCPFLKIVPSNNKKHEELQQRNNKNNNEKNERAACLPALQPSAGGVQEMLYESPDVSCVP